MPWKEKARICICGNFHPGIFDNVSTTNVDGHLLRLFLSQEASEHKILASTDVRNAFLNAKIEDDLLILARPPPELIKMGIVERGTIWKCKRACYGLKEAPKMREEHRDDLLNKLEWEVANDSYHLKISNVHPSLWYIMKGKRQPCATPSASTGGR